MTKFTSEMVDKYAENLLIKLSKAENQMVLDEFETIDKDIDIINTIENISEVKPMTHALEDAYITTLREDIEEESLDVSELLKNAKQKIGREIVVPKVVGNDEV